MPHVQRDTREESEMKILTRIKDWYLGGDPNDDSHLRFRTVGWGPFPMPGERGRRQHAGRDAAEDVADALQEMLGKKLHITACFATEDGPMHMTREFDSVDDMAEGLLAFMDQIRTIESRLRPLDR